MESGKRIKPQQTKKQLLEVEVKKLEDEVNEIIFSFMDKHNHKVGFGPLDKFPINLSSMALYDISLREGYESH